MNIQIPAWAQSSVDPEQVSLTISSFSKAVIGILTTYAVLKGIDPIIMTNNVRTVTEAAQNIVAQYIAILPALYAAYHSAQAIYGVLRKLAVYLFVTKTV
jgi:hypothetical protein